MEVAGRQSLNLLQAPVPLNSSRARAVTMEEMCTCVRARAGGRRMNEPEATRPPLPYLYPLHPFTCTYIRVPARAQASSIHNGNPHNVNTAQAVFTSVAVEEQQNALRSK